MSLSRRTLLQMAAVLAAPRAAEAALPSDEWTRAAMARLSTRPRYFDPTERATISAIADAIIPRSDSVGALDVGVPDFIELLLEEWASDADRRLVRVGLVEIDNHAMATHGATWPALTPAAASAEIAWGENRTAPVTDGQRAFRRLKDWMVHGWITSEAVQKTVIHTNITPGVYEGCAPITPAARNH